MNNKSSLERASEFNRSKTSNATSANSGNKVNYFNSNFLDGSDSSCQGEGFPYKSTSKPQTPPRKILPMSNFPSASNGIKQDPLPVEKRLSEMGFNLNEIGEWDKIVQPHKKDLMVLLKNMIENYIKTNVKIQIDKTTFNCHMMVLQCYSDLFMELGIGNEQIVSLPVDKVTPKAFAMTYDWMLSSHPMVQLEGILELFKAAKFLKIKGLVDQCWVCLDDDHLFREDAAFLLYLEARKYEEELIAQLMLSRICKFFLTLVASKEFLELTHEEICTLLRSNSIGVNSEAEVLMVATRWLSYDWNEREKHMLQIISCVRFALMPPWLLVALRRNHHSEELQRIMEYEEVQKMVDDGLSYGTTKFFYSNNPENFINFLENFKLAEPLQRQWICDESCEYHHKNECPNEKYITYESFLEYLEMIRSLGKNHWKSVQTRNESEPNLRSCHDQQLMHESGIVCSNIT